MSGSTRDLASRRKMGRFGLDRLGLAPVGAFVLLILLALTGVAILLANRSVHDPLRALMQRYARLRQSGSPSELAHLGTDLVNLATAQADKRADSLVYYSLLTVTQDPAFRPEDRVRAARFLGNHFAHAPHLVNAVLNMGASGDPGKRSVLETFANSSRPPLRLYAAYALAQLLAYPAPPARRSSRDLLGAIRLLQQVRRLGTEYRHPLYSEYTLAELADGEIRNLTQLRRGETAPEIAGFDLSGQPLKLTNFRGKVVVLYFWAGW